MVYSAALAAAAALMAALSIMQLINPPSMAGVGAVSAGLPEALIELVLVVGPAIVLNFAFAARGSRAIFWSRVHFWVTALLCMAAIAGPEIADDFETALRIQRAAFAALMATQMAFGMFTFVLVLRSTERPR